MGVQAAVKLLSSLRSRSIYARRNIAKVESWGEAERYSGTLFLRAQATTISEGQCGGRTVRNHPISFFEITYPGDTRRLDIHVTQLAQPAVQIYGDGNRCLLAARYTHHIRSRYARLQEVPRIKVLLTHFICFRAVVDRCGELSVNIADHPTDLLRAAKSDQL